MTASLVGKIVIRLRQMTVRLICNLHELKTVISIDRLVLIQQSTNRTNPNSDNMHAS